MAEEFMLTTLDNPYNPFENFEDWYAFDEASGYHTTGLLARFTVTSEELSEADQELAISDAMDQIIKENIYPSYLKIKR